MNPIKCYLAAPWAEREMARGVRDQLLAAGYIVNSRWLDYEKDAGATGLEIDSEELKAEALHDLEDVIAADAFILLNTQARGAETSGKAVETGVAIALLKPIIMIGKPSNVFHYLDFPRFETVEGAIVWMNGERLTTERGN